MFCEKNQEKSFYKIEKIGGNNHAKILHKHVTHMLQKHTLRHLQSQLIIKTTDHTEIKLLPNNFYSPIPILNLEFCCYEIPLST